ncbi:MAG TPA: 2-dehydropantoate 2-reductase [Vicinamibacteria bacterium]|jgi:2-dehydropantoate 2-reductase|nr:2-dehydropantoate 2-reductase [Vicinamibacteria bacterium]
MRIVIFGAGGVGGYFGGRLAQAGESVVFIARGEHLKAIRAEGLRVESIAGDFQVRAEATDDCGSVGQVDAVLVCVKAWQVQEAAQRMAPMLGPQGFVVPLGNGVEAADELGRVVGKERVLGGLCRILSYLVAPGRIRHAAMDPRVEFGERDGRESARVGALRAIFERARGLSVHTPGDINVAVWEKFLFIAPFSGLGAVTRMPAGVMRGVPETRDLLTTAMQEVWDLARARGIAVGDEAVARTMRFVDGMPKDATASMQRDILEGRPSELEYQNGAVVRLGREGGVPVAVNEFIYRCLLPSELRARDRLSGVA